MQRNGRTLDRGQLVSHQFLFLWSLSSRARGKSQNSSVSISLSLSALILIVILNSKCKGCCWTEWGLSQCLRSPHSFPTSITRGTNKQTKQQTNYDNSWYGTSDHPKAWTTESPRGKMEALFFSRRDWVFLWPLILSPILSPLPAEQAHEWTSD